jgi:uncharacterized protein
MSATDKRSNRLTAAEVLRRYSDELLPAFVDISLHDVNQVGLFHDRPLHVACVRGDLEEVEALVEGGADVNAPGEHGNTPLHEAVSQAHKEVIKYLLERGAIRSSTNEFGETPSDFARSQRRYDIVEVLSTED